MEEPRCKKCDGWLDHREDSLWICKKCGRKYLYMEDLSIEDRYLQNISGVIKSIKESITSESMRLELFLSELNCLARDHRSLAVEGAGLERGCQHSLCLLQKYFDEVDEFVEELRMRYVNIEGGHFESFSSDEIE